MKKRILSLLLAALLLTGCAPSQRYRVVYYSLFDTVTTVMTARGKQSDFEKTAAGILEDLRQYHRLFDIYQEYEGLVNLKTLNDQAGLRPQKVDPELFPFPWQQYRHEILYNAEESVLCHLPLLLPQGNQHRVHDTLHLRHTA